MTNEQAINELKDWQTAFSNMDKDMSYAIEAFDVAIKALEKQARLEALIDMGTEYADRMYKEGNADD